MYLFSLETHFIHSMQSDYADSNFKVGAYFQFAAHNDQPPNSWD